MCKGFVNQDALCEVDYWCYLIKLPPGLLDPPASRNSTGTLLGYKHQADILSICTNISLTPIIDKYRLTL